MRNLLTAAQVAEQLNVGLGAEGFDETWVYRHKDEIGYYRVGVRLVRFDQQHLDDYLERCFVAPQGA